MTLVRQILLGALLLLALYAYYAVTQHRIAAAESRATVAEANVKTLQGDLAASKSSEHIVTVYVDRWHTILQAGATLIRKVPVYVTAHDDAACTIPLGFVRLHDAAATGTALPNSAGAADAQPSGLALSAVAGSVVDNYTTCRGVANQLTSLQEWVRANSDAAPSP